jgi:dihydroorotase
MVPFDLLIKGGHVLDPGQNINGKRDLGVTAGRIAAIEPDLPATEARRVIEVRGDNRYVTPGLIDIHTHVAYGATTPGVSLPAPTSSQNLVAWIETVVSLFGSGSCSG